MKTIFWFQIAACIVVAALQVITWFLGADWRPGITTENSKLFLISAGFLWIHGAITAQKVKP